VRVTGKENVFHFSLKKKTTTCTKCDLTEQNYYWNLSETKCLTLFSLIVNNILNAYYVLNQKKM